MGRRRRGGRSAGRGGNWAAPTAGQHSAAAAVAPAKEVPSDEKIDNATALDTLRSFEGAILAATRSHEESLAALREQYVRVRAKMYRDHKQAVIEQDNSALRRFQGGCPKPKEVGNLRGGATKEDLDRQAKCLQV